MTQTFFFPSIFVIRYSKSPTKKKPPALAGEGLFIQALLFVAK
jgi:hypothetical protein